MKRSELLEKANNLPLKSGVYLMKNKDGKIIYVGKSKSLRNRVTSYFVNSSNHSLKTAKMVSNVEDFEYYVTDNEVEALVLENKFIKQYMPKYNIKLKDSKGYPYIVVTEDEYPRLDVTYNRTKDGAYFGPFTSVTNAWNIVESVKKTVRLPLCKKVFPRDLGTKECLNYHIKQCDGICLGKTTKSEYVESINEAKRLLGGDYKALKREFEKKMLDASEEMLFERAAKYRDCMIALTKLSERQKIVSSPDTNEDVFGYYTDDAGSTLTVLMVRGGAITDRDKFFFRADEIFDSESITSFLVRFYDMCDFIPKTVICDYELEEEDRAFLEKYLSEKNGSKINVRVPQVGDKKKLARMASENALELTKVYREEITRDNDFLLKITKLLGLEIVPERIEAYDASNSGEENTTVGMIVLENGKFAKKKYRSFGIKTTVSDDYGAIREAVIRRMDHKNDEGWELPDLMLIDGGVGHVSVVNQTLKDLGVELPVLGMVKDDHHKTRTLTDGENEISIANIKDVFTFFYKIQEEVHRFTLSRMDTKRRKAVKKSSLEEIEGIGEKKAKILNGRFGGLRGIKEASLDELMTVKGLTERDATRVYSYFHKEENGEIK